MCCWLAGVVPLSSRIYFLKLSFYLKLLKAPENSLAFRVCDNSLSHLRRYAVFPHDKAKISVSHEFLCLLKNLDVPANIRSKSDLKNFFFQKNLRNLNVSLETLSSAFRVRNIFDFPCRKLSSPINFCRWNLRKPELKWIFRFIVGMTPLNWSEHDFCCPYCSFLWAFSYKQESTTNHILLQCPAFHNQRSHMLNVFQTFPGFIEEKWCNDAFLFLGKSNIDTFFKKDTFATAVGSLIMGFMKDLDNID